MQKPMKPSYLKAFVDYIGSIQANLAAGHASEGSHYPALKSLRENLGKKTTATSLPSRIDCGAPDFVLTKGSATVGCVEAKDIGKSLDEAEQTEQLRRYRDSLANFILTDYLEFRWYVDGERRLLARLGTLSKDGKIRRDREGKGPISGGGQGDDQGGSQARCLKDHFGRDATGSNQPRVLSRVLWRPISSASTSSLSPSLKAEV